MDEKSSIKMSQGYDVIPPNPGKAYPILCREWDYIKEQVKGIKTSFGLFHTIGSVFIGAGLTTLITILLDGIKKTENNITTTTYIIAWCVVVTCLLIGATCLYFAKESQDTSDKKAENVVTQMVLIEERYKDQ